MKGYPVSVVPKKIINPEGNKIVTEARLGMNVGTIVNKRSMERILGGMSKGEAVAMALDQNMMKNRGGLLTGWADQPVLSDHLPMLQRKQALPL